jgi:hypothetical protein
MQQACRGCMRVYFYAFFLPRGKVRLQTSCKGCHNPTPHWTRQIQARPNQPWARCSVITPPPAGRGRVCIESVLLVDCAADCQLIEWVHISICGEGLVDYRPLWPRTASKHIYADLCCCMAMPLLCFLF